MAAPARRSAPLAGPGVVVLAGVAAGPGLVAGRPGTLVAGQHRGVVERRRGQCRGGQGVAGDRAQGRPVAVRGRARVAGRVVVVAAGLGAGDQVHERAQVRAADLQHFVAFLAQRAGDGPAAVHRDAADQHPDAEFLHLGDDLGEVLVPADHDRLGDRAVLRQRDQVAVHLALHALAAAGPQPAEPELEVGEVGERVVLGRAAALDRRLVPVAAEQREPGAVTAQPRQQLEQTRVIPGNRVPAACTVNGHRAVGKHVARVHEKRAAIHQHRPPSPAETLPAARRRRGGKCR